MPWPIEESAHPLDAAFALDSTYAGVFGRWLSSLLARSARRCTQHVLRICPPAGSQKSQNRGGRSAGTAGPTSQNDVLESIPFSPRSVHEAGSTSRLVRVVSPSRYLPGRLGKAAAVDASSGIELAEHRAPVSIDRSIDGPGAGVQSKQGSPG